MRYNKSIGWCKVTHAGEIEPTVSCRERAYCRVSRSPAVFLCEMWDARFIVPVENPSRSCNWCAAKMSTGIKKESERSWPFLLPLPGGEHGQTRVGRRCWATMPHGVSSPGMVSN